MNTFEIYAITKYFDKLVNNIDVNGMIDTMLSIYAINLEEYETIRNQPGRYEKTRTFLSILLSKEGKDDSVFETFLDKLMEETRSDELPNQIKVAADKARDYPELMKQSRPSSRNDRDCVEKVNIENCHIDINLNCNINLSGRNKNITRFKPDKTPARLHDRVHSMINTKNWEDLCDFCIRADAAQFLEIDKLISLVISSGRYDVATTFMCSVMVGNREAVNRVLKTHDGIARYADAHDRTALMYACLLGRVTIAKTLIENKADVNHISRSGSSPLVYAAYSGDIEMVTLLSKSGARVNEPRVSNSALMVAIYFDNLAVIKELLNNGADVNVVNEQKMFPLMLAIEKAQIEIFNLLLKYGADVSIKTSDGSTPLIMATKLGLVNFVKILLKKKAKTNILDDRSLSVIVWSSLYNDEQIFDLLPTETTDKFQLNLALKISEKYRYRTIIERLKALRSNISKSVKVSY